MPESVRCEDRPRRKLRNRRFPLRRRTSGHGGTFEIEGSCGRRGPRSRLQRRYASGMAVSPSVADRLVIAPEVAAALAEGRPVVALESTLISHGLPYPQNLAVAVASETAVRETPGAVPATVAIRDGRLLVGLGSAALEALATAPARSVRKAARPSLAIALAAGGWAATTVSATMIAASTAGIRVF